MQNRGKKSWTLYATKRPDKPGIYYIGFLYYAEENAQQGVEDQQSYVLKNVRHNLAEEFLLSEDCLVWFGPVNVPEVLPRTMTRLKREQRKVFVRDNEKHCSKCGHAAGVNARSIIYIDEAEDCKECLGKDTVVIQLKSKRNQNTVINKS